MTKLIELFINHLSAEEKAGNTTGHYVEALERFEAWLFEYHHLALSEADAGKITSLILVEYYQSFHQRNLKTATRNNYTVILKKFFRFLVNTGVLSEDPTAALHSVRERKKPDTEEEKEYTPEQLKALLELLSDPKSARNCARDAAVVALILGSGLRASEACGLNVEDAQAIKCGRVRCKRKGGGWANVEVAGFVSPYIERYLWTRGKCDPDQPLFLSQKGQRLTRTALWKSLRAKQCSVGIPTGVHRFRHTFTSDVDRNPIGGAAISRDLAGHRSVAVTNTYLHSNHEERQQVVNSMGYAELLKPDNSA